MDTLAFSLEDHCPFVDGLLDQRLVPTQQFVLFLYVQQSTKVSLKSKLVAGDEWKQSSPPFGQDSKSSSEAMRGKNNAGFLLIKPRCLGNRGDDSFSFRSR